MRFGRLLLAILAPLLSVSPALKADVLPESHAPAIDSLLNLLRSVVPASVATVDAANHSTARAPHVSGFSARPFLDLNLTPQLSPAAEANLHLIERDRFRFLLRC